MAGRFRIKWREFKSVFTTELKHIFKDGGVILIMILAILIYSTVYSIAYSPEVLRDIPIGVVDKSQTPSSRQLIRTFDDAPNIDVIYNPSSLEEAKELFYARKIYGIVYIGEDYENNIMVGTPAIVGVYVDASYFLMYRQVFFDVVAGITTRATEIGYQRLLAKGVNAPQAQAIVSPLEYKSYNLFNPYLGYGTFLMPAIIIVIIQQTLLIGIGMIGGTWREFGIYRKLRTPGEMRLSTVPIVLGKTAAYMSIYAVTLTYILTVHYKLFKYPVHAPLGDILVFMIPFVLACIFLGIALSTLFKHRESSIMFLLWTSIPMLLVSGASIPKEAIPAWLYNLGKIFPTSIGVDGFVRLQTMGASLGDIYNHIFTLWILVIVYFILACVGIRSVMSRSDVK